MKMNDYLLTFLDEFNAGLHDSNEDKIRDRNRGVPLSPPSPRGNLKYIFNTRTKEMRRSQDDADLSVSNSAVSSAPNSPVDRKTEAPRLSSTICPDLPAFPWNNPGLLIRCPQQHEAIAVVEQSTANNLPPVPSISPETLGSSGQVHLPALAVDQNVESLPEELAKSLFVNVVTPQDGDVLSPPTSSSDGSFTEEIDYEVDYRTIIHQKVRTSTATMAERPVPKTPVLPSEHKMPKTPKKEGKLPRYGETPQKSGGNLYLGKRHLSTEAQVMLADFATPAKITKRAMSLSEADWTRIRQEKEAKIRKGTESRGVNCSRKGPETHPQIGLESISSFPIEKMFETAEMIERQVAALRGDSGNVRTKEQESQSIPRMLTINVFNVSGPCHCRDEDQN